MNLLFFEQNFMINYHDDINQKSKLNKISNNLRANYLLLSFSSQVKNIIAITRIINLRKIVNCLLNRIIGKNKKYLKKTFAKFQDILKPKDNQRPFYIIYCTEKEVNGVAKKAFDIIIDFLMFIHDYTSSIIHLNNIKNYQNIIPKIENDNGENINTNEENENFEKLKIDFENLPKEGDIKIIKQILENMNYNKDLDINKLIKLYNDNKNEMADIRNTIEMYNEKIINYKFEYDEEFSIEKMISVYKSQFDKNSSIYEKSQNIIDQHYRFNSSYNKIIDSSDINNFNFDDIKSFIKKISGNELIDLLSEDQGRFGQELLIEDVV